MGSKSYFCFSIFWEISIEIKLFRLKWWQENVKPLEGFNELTRYLHFTRVTSKLSLSVEIKREISRSKHYRGAGQVFRIPHSPLKDFNFSITNELMAFSYRSCSWLQGKGSRSGRFSWLLKFRVIIRFLRRTTNPQHILLLFRSIHVFQVSGTINSIWTSPYMHVR